MVNAPVNIALPVNNTTINNYFTSSFTATCPGGMHTVSWYLDSTLVGSATFYNSTNMNFLHKLASGWHTLTVKSSCGSDKVTFYVI